MKFIFTAASFLLGTIAINAQTKSVAINNTGAKPHSSSILDVSSTDKGVLLPRMTSTQRAAIQAPAKGLLVFDSTKNTFWYQDGTTWKEISSGGVTTDQAITYGQARPLTEYTLGAVLIPNTTDTSGYIYDSGGPNGDYNANDDKSIQVWPKNNAEFLRINVMSNSMAAGGDFLEIKSLWGTTYALLTGSQKIDFTVPWSELGGAMIIHYKSFGGPVAAGFKIRFDNYYLPDNSMPEDNKALTGAFYIPKKIAWQGGTNLYDNITGKNSWDDINTGMYSFNYGFGNVAKGQNSVAFGYKTYATNLYSTSFGFKTISSGANSTAFGNLSVATGSNSTVMGQESEATGQSSTAMGYIAKANNSYATAMGWFTTASGVASTAMGKVTTASGDNSVAMGNNSIASGLTSVAIGSAAIADAINSMAIGNNVSTGGFSDALVLGSAITSTNSNQMTARFDNGYRFYTGANIGVSLAPGGNAWGMISDVRRKENFVAVDGENILSKISTMPLTTWNYKGQDPKNFRHYGPMAQDFFAAFGKDQYGTIGNDTTINSADFAGVSFVAIQALEKRTKQLNEENKALKESNEKLATELALIKEQLEIQNKSVIEQLTELQKVISTKQIDIKK